jgi:oxygen-dependent protoporphyrinogen oxidase
MERDQGGFIRSAMSARRRKPSTNDPDRKRPAGLVSLQGGLGELVSALERALNDRHAAHGALQIRKNVSVARVTRSTERGRGFAIALANGETVETDAVVVATPAPVSAAILRPLDAVLASELETIEYSSTVTINVAYRARDVRRSLTGTGYTVPRKLGRPVLACTFTSNKFDGRAPSDFALFRLFLGGAGRGDFTRRSDDELLNIVRTEMREVLGVSAVPVLVRINRHDRVMAQYNLGHLDRLARIDQRLVRMPGVALAGNAFRGVGIPDCITSGRRAAELVLAGLQTRSYSIAHLAS